MIRLIFFDLDNTIIWRADETIPDNIKGCMDKLHQNGIKVVIATGRWKARITDPIMEAMNPDYIISSNGQIIYDGKFNPIFEEYPDDSIIQKMKAYCIEHGARMYMKFEEGCYIYTDPEFPDAPDGTYVPFSGSYYHLSGDHNHNYHNLGGWFNLYSPPVEEISKEFPELSFYSLGSGYDFNTKGIGKNSAIHWLLDKLGISLEECMAFGDADSDVEMLKMVGIGVAMGNGDQNVKEAADYVTADFHDEGVKKALEHFKLI